MKRNLLTLALVAFAFVGLSAQKGIVKVNPLGFLIGNLNAGYEHVLNENSGIEVGLNYFNFDVSFGAEESGASGFGGYAMYRLYLGSSKDAPRGIYVAPVVGFGSSSFDVAGQDEKGKTSNFRVGGLFGHQWVWPKDGDGGFTLDLGLGVNYVSSSTDVESVTDLGLDGILPAFRLAIGYAF